METPNSIAKHLDAGEKVLWCEKPLVWPHILALLLMSFFILAPTLLVDSGEVGFTLILVVGFWLYLLVPLLTLHAITNKRILTVKPFSLASYDIRPTTKFSYSKNLFWESLKFDTEVGQNFNGIPRAKDALQVLNGVIGSRATIPH